MRRKGDATRSRAPPLPRVSRVPAYTSACKPPSPSTRFTNSVYRPARASETTARSFDRDCVPLANPTEGSQRGGCPSETVLPPSSGRRDWVSTSAASVSVNTPDIAMLKARRRIARVTDARSQTGGEEGDAHSMGDSAKQGMKERGVAVWCAVGESTRVRAGRRERPHGR